MTQKSSKLTLGMLGKVFGVAFFVYLFFGFMLLPCLNTITQIFTDDGQRRATLTRWRSSASSSRATCPATS